MLAHAREVVERGRREHAAWQEAFDAWAAGQPGAQGAVRPARQPRALPDGWTDALPEFPADPKGIATRAASGKVLDALAPVLPELWGGSADLAESNNTTMKGEPSFVPAEHATKVFPGDEYGRTLHFGIREHGMGAILNGIALHGGTRPYGGTFLVFSDYMRPAVRLAALMKLPVIYVWTHDSIGLGEDGPTHQPVEHLSALRAIPGLDVVRPADANETAWAWRMALEHTDRPDRAVPDPAERCRSLDRDAARAAPTAWPAAATSWPRRPTAQPQVILIGTGSEVQLCLTARERLEAEGVPTRVVSMPCQEWFRGAGRGLPRVGAAPRRSRRGSASRPASPCPGATSSATPASASALSTSAPARPYQVLFEQFGFTPDRVVAAARAVAVPDRRDQGHHHRQLSGLGGVR